MHQIGYRVINTETSQRIFEGHSTGEDQSRVLAVLRHIRSVYDGDNETMEIVQMSAPSNDDGGTLLRAIADIINPPNP